MPLSISTGVSLDQLDVRLHADTDDCEVRLDVPPRLEPRAGEQPPVAVQLLDRVPERELDAVLAVQVRELGRELLGGQRGHQPLAYLDHGHVETAQTQRGGDLAPDEAAPDDDCLVRLGRLGAYGRRVRERSVRVDADPVGPGHAEASAGGRPWQARAAVRDRLAVGERHLARAEVEARDLDAEPEVDHVVVVELEWLDERLPLVLYLATQEPFRERRPVVRRAIVGGEDRDELVAALLAIRHGEARCREAPSDDDDAVLHSTLLPRGRTRGVPLNRSTKPSVASVRGLPWTAHAVRLGSALPEPVQRCSERLTLPSAPARRAGSPGRRQDRHTSALRGQCSHRARRRTSSTAGPAGRRAGGAGYDRIAVDLTGLATASPAGRQDSSCAGLVDIVAESEPSAGSSRDALRLPGPARPQRAGRGRRLTMSPPASRAPGDGGAAGITWATSPTQA